MAKKGKKAKTMKKTKPFIKPRIPLGVKIIAILLFISAVGYALAGLIMFIGGLVGSESIVNLISEMSELQGVQIDLITSALKGILIFGGLIMVSFGILFYYLGKGLWKGRNWARIAVIVLVSLMFIKALLTNILLFVLIHGFIGAYLLFSKKVKRAFR